VIFEVTETAAMTNIAAARLFAETLNAMGCKPRAR
jgi:EAL domain-containing protein (putative c-di-GMP-specific phosphodiesterase class I)